MILSTCNKTWVNHRKSAKHSITSVSQQRMLCSEWVPSDHDPESAAEADRWSYQPVINMSQPPQITTLTQHHITVSATDALQWMGAVRSWPWISCWSWSMILSTCNKTWVNHRKSAKHSITSVSQQRMLCSEWVPSDHDPESAAEADRWSYQPVINMSQPPQITTLTQHHITVSATDALQWMGAVRSWPWISCWSWSMILSTCNKHESTIANHNINTASHQCLSNGCPAVNGCRQIMTLNQLLKLIDDLINL